MQAPSIYQLLISILNLSIMDVIVTIKSRKITIRAVQDF